MESDKYMFDFFKEFLFIDQSGGGNDVNVNVVRKFFINRFHKAVPPNRIIITLPLVDDIILKLHNKDLDGIQDDMYSVRGNVLYMLSCEKFVEKAG